MCHISIAAVAALALSLVSGTASIAADEEVTASTCQSMEAQVRSALDSGQAQSSTQQEVQKEREAGHQYCSRGFYKIGTEHFAEALKRSEEHTSELQSLV